MITFMLGNEELQVQRKEGWWNTSLGDVEMSVFPLILFHFLSVHKGEREREILENTERDDDVSVWEREREGGRGWLA